MKAKRSLKRKRVLVEQQVSSEPLPRPKKRPKTDELKQAPRRPTQIISSLFTSNPAVEQPVNKNTKSTPSIPSNAPLTDAASFVNLGLHPLLASHLATKMNIAKPTSIQRAVLSSTLSSTSQRDIFIQSQTGSGKTLAFLLPIVQDLLPLSSLSYIDRSVGTLAVIIAPTRELAKQISDVLESLLKLRLRAEDEFADDADPSRRLTRWLVSGLLIGGATRTHEKARLRKGVPILVSTPGRLLDHLQNTTSFNVGKCRWLVLDEADRLMELGFEETIKGIIKSLDGHRKLAIQASEQGIGQDVGGWEYTRSRRTILCSATIQDDVQQLAGNTLSNPVMIKATKVEPNMPTVAPKFTPPSQLSQKYVIVPLKLRLVVLAALLRSLIGQSGQHSDMKIVVFLSCTDSVDFHWYLLGGAALETNQLNGVNDDESSSRDTEQIGVKCALLPDTLVFRLHGSLSTQIRLDTVAQFSQSTSASVLFCTSVASRGLDLPLVSAVVQYDLPTEGGATEYVHRVGRTARAGRGGQAWAFVAPSEVDWVEWIEKSIVDDKAKPSPSLMSISMDTVLRNGFGGKADEYQERATEVQLSFERWVLEQKDVSFKK